MGYAQIQRKHHQTVGEREGDGSGSGSEWQSRGYGLSNSVVRAGLRVGAAHDAAEREADRVASEVTGGGSRLHEQDASMENAAAEYSSSQESSVIQRSVEAGAEEGGFAAGPELEASMGRSAGQSIDPAAAAQIGGRLGADFSGVRVHTDRHAEQVAMGMSARAFTKGKDIYFNRGQYNPGTPAGQELLAHELTHTIQQGQISQEGGIPVTQTASAQTAQRGFFSLRKHFRQAVDERNEHYEDYKNQSKWTRFKWAVKNPLAWMFGRTKANQENTRQRTARRDLVNGLSEEELLAFDENAPMEEPVEEAASEGAAPGEAAAETAEGVGASPSIRERAMQLEAALNTPGARAARLNLANQRLGEKNEAEKSWAEQARMGNVSLGGSIGGGVIGGMGTGLTMLGRWNEASGLGNTFSGLSGNSAVQALKLDGLMNKLGTEGGIGQAADKAGGVLKDVGGGLSIAGGLAGVTGGLMDTTNALVNASDFWEGGDKEAAVASGLDAVKGGSTALKGVMTIGTGAASIAGPAVPVFSQVSGGIGMIGGMAKMGSAGLELHRTGKVLDRTGKAGEGYEEKLDTIQKTRQMIAEQKEEASEEEKEALSAQEARLEMQEKRLKAQAGFMRMGHNTAEVDRLRAKYKMASGTFETVGGAISLAGGGGAGTAVSTVGTVIDLAGKIHSGKKDTALKRGEVDRSLDMEARIDKILEKAQAMDARQTDPSKKLNLTRRDAKHIVLRQEGLVSRSEAYLKLAKERKGVMDEIGTEDSEERDNMVHALGLDPKKASESVIYQRLGLDKKQSTNVDRAILKQQKKRLLPSWRR